MIPQSEIDRIEKLPPHKVTAQDTLTILQSLIERGLVWKGKDGRYRAVDQFSGKV